MDYLSTLTETSSPVYTWIQFVYIVVVSGLGLAALRRHALGKKNWWIPVIPFILLILPVLLQGTLVYEIRVNQTDIIVNEPIHVDIVLRNPVPFWIWSNGFNGLFVDAVTENMPNINQDAVAASGSTQTERGLVKPFEVRIIHRRRFTFNETGPVDLRLIVGGIGRDTNVTKTMKITLDPLLVENIQVNPNGADLPFLRFDLSNNGDEEIVQLNAMVGGYIMPWSFSVDRDNHMGVNESRDYRVSTRCYDPTQKEVLGFNPQNGFPYKVTIKAKYADGVLRTRTFDVIAEEHHYITSFGVDKVLIEDTSLLATKDYTTLAFCLENGWNTGEMLRISRVHVYLNSSRVLVVDKMTSFGNRLAVSSILEEQLERGGLYNVTMIAYSTTGEISKNTEFVHCEPYIVQRIHLMY